MRALYGFAGKTLYVNLSAGDINSKPLSRQLAEKFIGGMGIGSWLAYKLVEPETDALSPDNALVYGVGPLVGTMAPGASRVYANSKSPLSGLVCQGSAGHSTGIMIKYAGYDNLVITGRAEKPVYLRISDDEVEICDARHLWGRDTWDTSDLIQKELGDYWVDCIGPAAENLVRYSIVLCSKRSSFNKTGLGTVMGSKNLKAIAARGTKGVRVADPERFKELTDEITRRIVADPELEAYRAYGGPSSGFSQSGFSSKYFYERIAETSYACLSCPVACKHFIKLKDGSYQGLSYRISHLAALADHSRLGSPENWDELAKVVEIENRYGIEAAGTASMLSYLVDCYEHGILTEEEIGFVPKRGGRALRELIPMIVRKEGIGALAAEGILRASREVGKNSEKYAKHIKGVGREHRLGSQVSIQTIGSLTNPRGGHGDMSPLSFSGGTPPEIDQEAFRRFCMDLGLRRRVADRVRGEPVSRLIKWVEDYTSAYVSTGFCIKPILMRHINLDKLSELYAAATGLEVSPAQLLVAGERVFNVLKAFNVKAGATRRDDMPGRGATWPSDKTLVVSGKEYGTLNQILDQYYDERGWDVKTGFPTRQKLTELGLGEVADDVGI